MKDFAKTQSKQQYYTRAIDITFTLILIFFTIVFVDYVMKSVAPKTDKAPKSVKTVRTVLPKTAVASHIKRKLIKPVTYGRLPVFIEKTKPVIVKHDSVATAPAALNQVVTAKLTETDSYAPTVQSEKRRIMLVQVRPLIMLNLVFYIKPGSNLTKQA